ncbi:MAG: energy transducer TonB [Pyrinomonadaceae bacterium]
MFNNLIESSSHSSELRRRGSFFLLTTASYALLLVIAVVVSIHAYDARMEDQSLQLVTMMPLVDLPTPQPEVIASAHSGATNNTNKQRYFERKTAVASVEQPQLTPDRISTTPHPELPMPDSGLIKLGIRDSNPGSGGGLGDPGGSSDGPTRNVSSILTEIGTPPPAPEQKPAPTVIRKKIINSEAISLPKPIYPPIAKQTRTQGSVSVQVLIDETGKVISAKVISGSPLLSHEAVRAAYQALFSPTLYGDRPVKVSGVITYNFVLQ